MAVRKIYIANDHDGDVLGIVIAESEAIAHAYFVGRGQIPQSMGVVDPADERLGILGLVTLFKTREISWSDLAQIASRRAGTMGAKPLRVEDRS